MATYVVLFDWTDQGVGNFKDTVDRYEAGHSQFEEMGVTLKDTYWTMGGHDLVAVAEAPDDQTLAAALLTLASLGNLRTTTLRAFTADEMREVIAKTG